MGNNKTSGRRDFIKKSGAISVLPFVAPSMLSPNINNNIFTNEMEQPINSTKSVIGQYGSWVADLLKKTPSLSFRDAAFTNIDTWKKEATSKVKELVLTPKTENKTPKAILNKTYVYDGLQIEELEWQLPYGRKTEAILLKPLNTKKPLPAVLALHDHGGNKYFGKRKITKTSENQHPLMTAHQKEDYSGYAWANEIAKKGYVVLVHDAFSFASRRVMYKDLSNIPWGNCKTKGLSDENPENEQNIKTYNTWAINHEHIMAKALFCGSTTWPGMVLYEDQIALDILSNRPDVLSDKIGCGGLSGGGVRTNFLAGLDQRIKCAVSVGFNTTWNDFIMSKAYAHTWMAFTPALSNYLEFIEIIGLRVPLPTMVLNNNEDSLYTLSEMKKANEILKDVFKKAGAEEKYSGKFYPGPHKFDINMQNDAMDWFNKWLK